MRKLIAVILLVVSSSAYAQIGGSSSFQFLNHPNSARNAAMGGRMISIMDNDLNLAIQMPSLLDSTDHDQLVFNYNDFLSDISYGAVGYARHYEGLATFAASIQYISYGEFNRTDVTGFKTGTFTAGEYVLNLGAGYAVDSQFSLGSNLKFITSNLEDYNASGVAVDLSGNYRSKDTFFSAGLLIRNVGFTFDNYTDSESLKLPFGIDLGLTRKLPKSPFRFSLTLENLQQWDLTFIDQADLNQIDPLTGLVIELDEENALEKGMRHVILGTDFILSENFHLRFGYNFRRRAELKFENKPATSGISWGVAFRVSKFRFGYGRANYNHAGTTNHISMTLRLSDFKRS